MHDSGCHLGFASPTEVLAVKPIALLLLVFCFASPAQAFFPQASSPLCVPEEVHLLPPDEGGALGHAVTLDGDTAALSGGGGVYVFRRQGASWVREAKLLGSDSLPGDYFGCQIALHGDTIVVGAKEDDSQGSAYVFVRQGEVWSEQAKLTAPDAFNGQEFGHSVAIHGDTAVVGAPAPDNWHTIAAAYVFERQGSSWTLQVKFDDPTRSWYSIGEFGDSIAISEDTIVVGEPYFDSPSSSSGAVYVYRWTGTSWYEEAMLQPHDVGYKHRFGISVSICGDSLVVGSIRQAAYSNSVYVFEHRGSVWTETQQLVASTSAGEFGDRFGLSVSIAEDVIVVGAPWDKEQGVQSGAAYVFVRTGPRWMELAKVSPAAGIYNLDEFGSAVAADDRRVLVGRPRASEFGYYRGAGHIFEVPPSSGEEYCNCDVGSCGNSFHKAGCANSTGEGAHLLALGSTDPDEVTLVTTGTVPGQLAIHFQADRRAQHAFGDGLRCAVGGLVPLTRIPRPIDPFGTVGYGSCLGDPLISERTGVVPGSGVTRFYQCWFRDPSGPCGSSFNTTNGVAITW
jgi:hypothetical protein